MDAIQENKKNVLYRLRTHACLVFKLVSSVLHLLLLEFLVLCHMDMVNQTVIYILTDCWQGAVDMVAVSQDTTMEILSECGLSVTLTVGELYKLMYIDL